MKKRREEWLDAFRDLGEAFLGVVSAETGVLRDTVTRSFRHLGIALGIFFVVACLFFVLIALLVTGTVLAVQHFAELEPWQAVFAVALGVFLLMAVLAAIAWAGFLRRFENPIATARRRVDDHLTWWRERLLESGRALPRGEPDEGP